MLLLTDIGMTSIFAYFVIGISMLDLLSRKFSNCCEVDAGD